METIKIEMKIRKTTKRTTVYEASVFEDDDTYPVAITGVYIQTSALPDPAPQYIILSIEAKDA